MKVSYDEGLASHVGSESCVGVREDTGEALTDFGELDSTELIEVSRTGESAGWVLSSEILNVRDADAVMSRGRQHRSIRQREGQPGPAESQTPEGGFAFPCTHRSISRGRRSLLSEGSVLRIGSREISGSTWARGGKFSDAHVRAVNPKGAKRR